ncbi:MAG: hypothetical protein INQ03_00650 [Candidatus Heimdallarchaeota archaeon]|nr:hypothetical protein [Candidatus Heimdallarchaeota archaeon]
MNEIDLKQNPTQQKLFISQDYLIIMDFTYEKLTDVDIEEILNSFQDELEDMMEQHGFDTDDRFENKQVIQDSYTLAVNNAREMGMPFPRENYVKNPLAALYNYIFAIVTFGLDDVPYSNQ